MKSASEGSCLEGLWDGGGVGFCYKDGKPGSLVMLHAPEKVVQKMMEPPHQSIIIWIIDPIPQHLIPKLTQFQTETNSKLTLTSTPIQAHQLLLQTKSQKNITLICPPQLTKSIKYLNRLKQISTIIQYPAQMEDSDEEVGKGQGQAQGELGEGQGEMGEQGVMVIQSQDEEMLFKDLRRLCEVRQSYRELVNFVTVRDGVKKSHFLARTLMAMIHQDINVDTRRQILVYFQKLLTHINKNFRELIHQLSQGPLSIQRALYWYTHQIGIYKIINNLLRSTSHPCQTFYLQPLFKDIFLAIEALHKKEKKQNFICFRGGHLYKDEAEQLQANVGQIVKNLSFLSTSRDRETALGFVRNTFFEIVVEGLADAGEQNLDYGYANVKQYSYFSQEQQIIFNPLCSFKILQIQQTQPNQQQPIQYYIKLEYGSLTKLALKSKSNKKLTEHENCLYTLGKIWKQDYSVVNIQGAALSYRSECLEGSLEYWEMFGEIGVVLEEKCQGLIKCSLIHKNKGNYTQYIQTLQKAQKLFTTAYPNFTLSQPPPHSHPHPQFPKPSPSSPQFKAIDIYRRIQVRLANAYTFVGKDIDAQLVCTHAIQPLLAYYSEEEPEYYELLSAMADNLLKMRKFEKSEEFRQKISKYDFSKVGQAHPNFLASIINQSISNYEIGNYQKSQQLLQKCQRLLLTMVGQAHPDYLSCLKHMAKCYYYEKSYKKAYDLSEKCCRLAERIFGDCHPLYLHTFVSLGNVLLEMGDFGRAQQVYQKYLTYENSSQLTQDHAEVLSKLSKILSIQGKPSQSLQYQKKSYELTTKQLGQDHPISITSLKKLVVRLEGLGRSKEAEEMFRECFQRRLDKIIQENPEEIRGLYVLGDLLQGKRDYWGALGVYWKAAELSLRVFGENSLLYLDSLSLASNMHTRMNQHSPALQILQKCCILTPQIPQVTARYYPDYITRLFHQLLHYQKYQLGIETITKSQQRALEIYGPDHPYFCGFYGEMLAKLRIRMGCCGDGVIGEMGEIGEIGWGGLDGLGFFCDVLMGLGKYWQCIGKAIQLYKLAKIQKSKQYSYFALKTIIESYLRLGFPKKSKKLLQLLIAPTQKNPKSKKTPNKKLTTTIKIKQKKSKTIYSYLDFNY